ncbi:hypothetical protein JOC86_002807 [Bacillus pakistanensis]|uniref:Uncharacterized protein n=1 Tax=Rossellomorea pakistanensis TaxID=992288 RepID=A0ABS2NEI5_9BACI|nr:hypothetical protein [Bacillus pakistanensis]MBM7586265.1 hypothetical protein [Bacillus pakistanensis]
MDDKMLEKRLDLLNKSYHRIPPQTDSSEVLKAIEKEVQPKKPTKKRKRIHWPYAASFIGVILISTVLAFQFSVGKSEERSNANQKKESIITSEKVQAEIEEARKLFEMRMLQSKESVGLTKEAFEETYMYQSAKSVLRYAESAPKRDLTESEQIKLVHSAKEEIERSLLTPEQMIRGLVKINPEEADNWMNKFLTKHNDLTMIYEGEIQKLESDWQKPVQNGKDDIRALTYYFYDSKEQPKQLMNLLEGATFNGVELKYLEDTDSFHGYLDYELISIYIRENPFLPELYKKVLKLKGSKPAIITGEMQISWKEAGERLIQYEQVLSQLPNNSNLKGLIMVEYDRLYQFFVHGTVIGGNQSIFNKDGILKKEVKDAFEYLIQTYQGTTTSKYIKNEYNDLKENQFTKPKDWEKEMSPIPTIEELSHN